MPFDPTQPYGVISGQSAEVPGAYYFQSGQYYDAAGRICRFGSGRDAQAASSLLLGATAGIKLSCIGTSLTQHGTDWGSTKIENEARGYISWVNTLLGYRCYFAVWPTDDFSFFRGSNKGVSGQFTNEVLARVQDVIRMRPTICIVDNGTNDAGSRDLNTVIDETRQIYDALRAAGIIVVAMGIPTRATSVSGYGSGSAARRKARAIDRWKRAYAEITPGVIYADVNKYWADPTDPDGQPRSGYSDDGIHSTPKGAHALALPIVEVLSPIIPPGSAFITSADDVFDSTSNPFGVFSVNPLLQGTSGVLGASASGSVATSYRAEILDNTTGMAVACSKVSRADGGDYQRLAITTAGTGGSTAARILLRTSTANQTQVLSSGDWMQGGCDIAVGAVTGDCVKQIALCLEEVNAITGKSLSEWSGYYFPTVAWSGRLQTPPVKIQSASNNYRWRMEMLIDAGRSGGVTIDVANMGARRVSDPSLILEGG